MVIFYLVFQSVSGERTVRKDVGAIFKFALYILVTRGRKNVIPAKGGSNKTGKQTQNPSRKEFGALV